MAWSAQIKILESLGENARLEYRASSYFKGRVMSGQFRNRWVVADSVDQVIYLEAVFEQNQHAQFRNYFIVVAKATKHHTTASLFPTQKLVFELINSWR